MVPGAGAFRSRALDAGGSRRASEVFLFSVWRRVAPLYWRAVCLDGRNVGAGNDRAEVASEACSGSPGGAAAVDHAAVEVWDEDAGGIGGLISESGNGKPLIA